MAGTRLSKRADERLGAFAPALAALLVALALIGPTAGVALAEDIDTDPAADEFQQEVERTSAEYNDAVAKVEQASAALDENRKRISELEVEIPEQAARSGQALREQYKLQQQGSGVLELLLGADSFYDFLASFEYIDRVSQANLAEVNRLSEMKAELDEAETSLKRAKRDADENAQRASEALAAAQAAREEAQRRAQEEARRQAEAAAAAAAEEEARAAEEAQRAQAKAQEAEEAQSASAQAQEADEQSEGQQADEETPAQASDDGADWSSDQKAFVDEWAPRIDAYLAGSPMAGTGKAFAAAAWNYGVDPRWSPAIACIESSKGAACFLPHNAWGWGSSSWSSWEAAIDEHVRGLARGYGYTISIDAAKKYCPPHWKHWYDATCEQMNLI